MELVCKQQRNEPLRSMVTALITTFLAAKLRDGKTSVAFYSVSSDVDGQKIAQQVGSRINKFIVRMLSSSSESLTTDPQLVASLIQGMMSGVSRRILESDAPEKQLEALRSELVVMACSYVDICTAPLKPTRSQTPNAVSKHMPRKAGNPVHESVTIH
jgi:hypothetical protein